MVIGESCLDVFRYCNGIKLAPDFPVPVVSVVREATNPGMAMNVFRNLAKYAENTNILTNIDWESVTKTRYVDDRSNHHFFRVDDSPDITRLKELPDVTRYDAIVVSDYDKGFLDRGQIQEICSTHNSVFLDTKKILGTWANNAKFIKINDYEFRRSKDFITREIERKLICTQGENGCTFKGKSYEVPRVAVRDTSGAGDAFFASLVLSYLDSSEIESAILIANRLASRVVSQRGVTTI